MSDNLPVKSEFLVYRTEDGRIKIDVRLEDETVWLTQQLMADLFQTTQQNISLHIRNIYKEGELSQEATHKKYLSVRKEGRRTIQKIIPYLSKNPHTFLSTRTHILMYLSSSLCNQSSVVCPLVFPKTCECQGFPAITCNRNTVHPALA